jgi:hypothetical protein
MRAHFYLSDLLGYSIEELGYEILYRIPPCVGDSLLKEVHCLRAPKYNSYGVLEPFGQLVKFERFVDTTLNNQDTKLITECYPAGLQGIFFID